jgi:hypothetical protein
VGPGQASWEVMGAKRGAYLKQDSGNTVMACSRRLEYGDSDFDLFAAQVPSPLFQRMGTTMVAAQAYGDSDFDFFAACLPSPLFQMMGTAYLGVLDAREYAAAASEASALESPKMSPVRVTGQWPIQSRVTLSDNCSQYSSSLYSDSSLPDQCYFCGEEDGVLLYCEGTRFCSAAVHAKCIESSQVLVQGEWQCETCQRVLLEAFHNEGYCGDCDSAQ